MEKKFDEAIADYTTAIQMDPDADIYVFRANCYSAETNWNAALSDLNEALRLKPNDSNGLFGRAYVFSKLGEFEKAISDLQDAMQFFSTNAKTNMTPVQIIEGNQNQMMSVQYMSITHNIVPYERICNSLAWLLATCPDAKCRDGKRAVTLATEACEHTFWKATPSLDTLAAAYAEAGDFDAAIKFENQALQQTDSISRHSAYQRRLLLYEQHQAYHQPENPFAN
jgi:tetratricopeptide (TPR) repeat protein